MLGGFGASLAVTLLFGTSQLLWFIVALFAGSLGVVWFAARERESALAANHGADVPSREIGERDGSGVVGTLKRFPLSSNNRSAYFSLGHSFDFDRLSVQGCGKGSVSVARSIGRFLRFLLCLAERRHSSCPGVVDWKASDGFRANSKSSASPAYAACGIYRSIGLARSFCGNSEPIGRSVFTHERQ